MSAEPVGNYGVRYLLGYNQYWTELINVGSKWAFCELFVSEWAMPYD